MAITLDGTNGVTTPNLTVNTTRSTVQNGGSVSAPAYGVITGALGVNGTYVPAANTLGFVAGGAERGRFTANGLTFNGDTAAANALDDYEEGTWTPTPDSGTWATYLNQWYTKIGNIVTCSFYLYGFSGGTSNAQVLVGGLPFAFNSGSEGFFQVGFVGGTNSLPTNTISITARIGQHGSNTFALFLGKVGNAYSNMQYSELGTGHYVATFSYQTA